MGAYNLTNHLKNVLTDMVMASRKVGSDEFHSKAMGYGMEFGIIFEAGGIEYEVQCTPADMFQLRDENLIALFGVSNDGFTGAIRQSGITAVDCGFRTPGERLVEMDNLTDQQRQIVVKMVNAAQSAGNSNFTAHWASTFRGVVFESQTSNATWQVEMHPNDLHAIAGEDYVRLSSRDGGALMRKAQRAVESNFEAPAATPVIPGIHGNANTIILQTGQGHRAEVRHGFAGADFVQLLTQCRELVAAMPKPVGDHAAESIDDIDEETKKETPKPSRICRSIAFIGQMTKGLEGAGKLLTTLIALGANPSFAVSLQSIFFTPGFLRWRVASAEGFAGLRVVQTCLLLNRWRRFWYMAARHVFTQPFTHEKRQVASLLERGRITPPQWWRVGAAAGALSWRDQ